MPASLQCASCGGKCGLLKCARCSCVGYCNLLCQQAHWALHRQHCHSAAALGVAPGQRVRAPVVAPTFSAANNSQVADLQLFAEVAAALMAGAALPAERLGALVNAGARFHAPLEAGLAGLAAPLRTTALHLACCLPPDKLGGVELLCPAAAVPDSARSWGMLPLAEPAAPLGEVFTPLGAALISDSKSPQAAAWLLRLHPRLVEEPCAYTSLAYAPRTLELLTPLQAACVFFLAGDGEAHREERVLLVLHACTAVGAPVGAVTPRSGQSALELLMAAGAPTPSPARTRLVRALLAAGATPACRQVNASGGRALDYGIRQGDAEVVLELLAAGAAVQPIALRGLDAQGGVADAAPGAVLHEDSVTSPALAAERGYAGVLRQALAAGLSPSARNCDWFAMPLLCTAIHYGRYECARLLLEEGGEGLQVNAMFPIVAEGGGALSFTVPGAGMEGADLLVLKDLQPVHARDATAMDCALGHSRGGAAAPGWLVEMLLARGGRTGAQLGGRASYCVRGGAAQ